MNITKVRDNLVFSYEDVTFSIRADATVKDRFELDMTGEWDNGTFTMSKTAYFMKLVELFVTGWTGVKDEAGKDVPYSFEKLCRLPSGSTDLILTLGAFIAEKVGILPEPEPKKGD